MYLRLSVTEACDFRCWYCRPTSDDIEPTCQPHLDANDLMNLVRAIHFAAHLHKVRITGGEPLLRKDIITLVAELRNFLPKAELALTTNARRLSSLAASLKQAGLDRINVSLDSLDPDKFRKITGTDALDRVLEGIVAAQKAGFRRTKLNAVLSRTGAGAELDELVRFAASHGAEIRFIELMPFGLRAENYENEFLAATEALDILRDTGGYQSSLPFTGTAERHLFQKDGQNVVVGFITSVSRPFCDRCDRLRLNAHGQLRACLRRNEPTDLLALSRIGRPALIEAITELVRNKKGRACDWPALSMACIGG